ncbi:phosphopyruvate hydratase [Candidatus Woesebacteria bacterium RIFOXYC1_FULL_41_14]|uniref:Enolase n=6 Tax=Candidatus Woeseibacteriota TaxID=1752722 RepID=A0A0G0UX40_9BACT|nr:MAG: Enolase [Candidatus Woesebacteria bacterium GW2011_GWF1_40_24]KKR89854.1 MAG: Enolase [Candidatus Woesebacteria bacterium GW2011_GWD1_41_12]KKS02923.1 MAG: Enolase [Candidatus Woesebacteria bacterium GW2011_GWE1_41_24]OGM81889.1 MAG: phosphopyruvate hydratase [Candidatus Woesebacteria bacterium RIFOXYB1_FULL_41_13]OGM84714.1 MAG: phosphopyruvate hydratase [Candidatus Woesebacteria bacterium RIFOXYC1_FULL_41_14]OGM88471.1 MAG: phosphopyruvate hydratase [Candidatus Woesebacteria bacteriu
MSKIKNVWAREILDSRGIPTVETACLLEGGEVCVSSVPAGASTGTHEALELRDTQNQRFGGMGVLQAVNNVNTVLGPAVIGMDPTDQEGIDKKLITLDGTENKTKYGANAILSISEVVAKCAATVTNQPLYSWIFALATKYGICTSVKVPTPLFNMINGGKHGAGNLDFQEFWVIPTTTKTYSEGLQIGAEIYHTIGENLKHRGAIHSVGDEGGYAPDLFTNADALEVFVESIRQSNYALGRDVLLGLDVASNSFYKDGEYLIKDRASGMSDSQLEEFYKALIDQYKLAIIEDPFFEDAWEAWESFTGQVFQTTLVVGDDLLCTNPKRVEKAIKEKACNSILVKPNQVGTITETLQVIKMAKNAGWKIIVSHRSAETNDSFIADFAVGVSADYVKFGAPARGERVAKYNRLSTIDVELGRMK